MAKRKSSQYQCFEHKMQFKSGTGFAAHMRSPHYHPNKKMIPDQAALLGIAEHNAKAQLLARGHRIKVPSLPLALALAPAPEPATEPHQTYTHLDAALVRWGVGR